eukprot:TRINITY_DN5195_c2_g1_i3.p1 TRINITY_DN5195_c2_g1~~TRINITY_DN5195_c2_g1_i3.p1  ORF type:complete len:670 (+),score=178.52 TRINITY_DN5195_c2_g1_i3:2563-4572(+)
MSGGSELTNAAFEKFSVFIKTPFWFELKKKKIHVFKLTAEEVPVHGLYSTPREANDKSKLELNKESFDDEVRAGPFEYVQPGVLLNYNTIEEYKAMEHKVLLRTKATELWNSIHSGAWLNDPATLLKFYIYSFSDLKAFIFRGRSMLPTLSPKTPIQCGTLMGIFTALSIAQVASLKTACDAKRGIGSDGTDPTFVNKPFFVVKLLPEDKLELATLSELTPANADKLAKGEIMVCMADPCTASHMGWPARNLLFALAYHFGFTTITLLSYRDQMGSIEGSKVQKYTVTLPKKEETAGGAIPDWVTPVGWEDGRSPVNLSKLMDSKLLASESANLNLSLMKWRMLPNLDLEKIAAQKCLLVGSGTLGCGVARNLMKWGIHNFTMIDRGQVSYSNTVRQSLFVHEDAVAGKNKALAAADACRRIHPLCKVDHVDMSVPMPGHIVSESEEEAVKATCEKFEKLIEEHDAVFLLTDSRESRWLPSMLGTKHKKIVINAALGFESYLAMRHGCPGGESKRLGCYFCNDITSPVDSLSDRTLDQQCTVTRPGVSDIASALAVELLTAVLSHPEGIYAQPPGNEGHSTGVLGCVPHQIRGGLYSFDQNLIRGDHFPNCVACSSRVVDMYTEQGFPFLLKVLNDSSYLPEISGITEMLKKSEDLDLESCSEDEIDEA